MKKLLTITVPSYNAADYLDKTVLSLHPQDKRIEIIIVNDGSKDDTGIVADHLAEQFPETIRVIHQENKGHGGAVNTGMNHAKGTYFKVVDSDDWLDHEAYTTLLETLETLETLEAEQQTIDMILCNFVYEKEGAKRKKTVSYANIFPTHTIFGWDSVKKMNPNQYLLMHSIIYRTKLLQKIPLILPEHTFYVDNLFAYVPLPYVQTLYYLDIDLYRYYTGREGQSVQLDIMLERISQQIRVNQLMLTHVQLDTIQNEQLRMYLIHFLKTVTMVTLVLLTLKQDELSNRQKNELWHFIKEAQPNQYRDVRYSFLGRILARTDRVGYFLVANGYRIAQKQVGFN